MPIINAIFENGIFRPLDPVQLPEGSKVQLEIPASTNGAARSADETKHLERVYDILSQRFDGGEKDIAARHDEHQP